MTHPKLLPEIARCRCGKRPKLMPFWNDGHTEWSVRCFSCLLVGPFRMTERGAINAWNRVMGRDGG